MLVLMVVAGWLAAACMTAAFFAVLARAGRDEVSPEMPTLPELPRQRTASADVPSLESSR